MIEVYAKGTTDFSRNGIRIHPAEAEVNFQENGQYTLDIEMPADGDYTEFDYGMILDASVPFHKMEEIVLGNVSYWTVTNQEGTKIWSEIPTIHTVRYNQWIANRNVAIYAVGNKVTYCGHNYQMIALDPGERGVPPAYNHPPDNYPEYWSPISGTAGSPGKELTSVSYGTVIMKVGDFNAEYMEVATLGGFQGYVKISDCTATGESGQRTIPGREITTQHFIITGIEKDQNGKKISISAQHISYQMGRTILGECSVTNVTPATALMFIAGAMKESYGGNLYTNLTEPEITGDWSWKNAQAAIMDPKDGLITQTNAKMIRDNLDVILIEEGEEIPTYTVRYGANMKNVKWTGNVEDIVTRVYPIAQTEDGRTLTLPEGHIDTVREIPFVRPEVLNTGLKVGTKEKQSDGTEVELTEETVISRMREQAQNRFTVDKCDLTEIKLELDWVHMPDTVEYEQFTKLKNVAPGEYVSVVNGPMGIRTVIRMTGYVWDVVNERYRSGTFGAQKEKPTVAGYNIANGAVGNKAIGKNAISSQNIQANSITAREIEAYSISADKIASKSISADKIEAQTITADEIAANAITAEKIAAGTITAREIAAHTITADQIAAYAITAGLIAADAVTANTIAAGAVTADKIDAGAVTAVKIAAGAITTDKLDAEAVTAGKIAAGAINADKIDANAVSAITAKLGIADIASAVIASADIGYAQVKDLTAGSAYFGQAVIQEGLANKLFIPRLSVDYAQVVSATIGDLVIQATDNNYYKLDVDMNGNVTATQVTPSAEEIAEGHTEDGRKIYMGTDIVASDLNTTNIYASHALMDEITANVINVDKLFAREATITKINAMDLSSNTYIQSTVGNWQGQSTITQTISSISSRISSLGYGTIYYSATEPSHEGLVQGDIWVQPLDDNNWGQIQADTWQQLLNEGDSWGTVMGKYKVYSWTGEYFKVMFDSQINVEMQTQIDQNTQAITLKADQSSLDLIDGKVTDFEAELVVQSQEISAAVSAVNLKAASYVMHADPTTVYTPTLGDIWVKTMPGFGSWLETEESTWQELKDSYVWKDALGFETYVWDGAKWVLTSDRAQEVTQNTLLEQTAHQISLMAEAQATLSGDIYTLSAALTVANDRITAEVTRATTAEGGKIDKTNVYQDADSIVTTAVSMAGSAADSAYIHQTSTYQDAQSIVTTAVAQANTSANSNFIKKTNVYQDAASIVSAAVTQAAGQAAGQYLAKTEIYQDADAIVAAAYGYTDDHAYAIQSGIEIKAAGIEISGSKYIRIKSGGKFTVQSGKFEIDTSGNVSLNGEVTATSGAIGGWALSSNRLTSGSGSGFVALNSNTSQAYAMWCGAESGASAPFRVKRDGTVTLTKLMVLGEGGTETEVNLRTYGLWKLNYNTVKAVTESGGYVASMTLSNGETVNFKSAAAGYAEAAAVSYSRRDGNSVQTSIPTSGGGVSQTTYTARADNSFAIHWGASRVIDGNVYVLARDTYLTGVAWVEWS